LPLSFSPAFLRVCWLGRGFLLRLAVATSPKVWPERTGRRGYQFRLGFRFADIDAGFFLSSS
jgi:hypothetical protein